MLSKSGGTSGSVKEEFSDGFMPDHGDAITDGVTQVSPRGQWCDRYDTVTLDTLDMPMDVQTDTLIDALMDTLDMLRDVLIDTLTYGICRHDG